MVTEVAILKIDPQKAKDFEKMYQEVAPILRRQEGYISDKLMHASERPEEYILAVEWADIELHKKFIASNEYALMADPFGHYVLDSGFAHYFTVAEN